MTTFAQHRATVESFVDCMHGGADKDTLTSVLAENVVLIGPATPTTPHSSGCGSKTRRSTGWTISCSTRMARSLK